MSESIAEKLESYDLQRFRNDFRRAMLMHRKGRLTLFFRLYFPLAEPLFGQGRDLLEQLDFKAMADGTPPGRGQRPPFLS